MQKGSGRADDTGRRVRTDFCKRIDTDMKNEKIFPAVLFLLVAVFVGGCGILIAQSGIFQTDAGLSRSCILLQSVAKADEENMGEMRIQAQAENTTETEGVKQQEYKFTVKGGDVKTVIIGAEDPCTENPESGFRFQLQLNSVGASIEKVTFSNGRDEKGRKKGFSSCDSKKTEPLVLLKPVEIGSDKIMTMANKGFILVEPNRQLPLGRLSWDYLGKETNGDGSESAGFRAQVSADSLPIINITKTYTARPGDYMADCRITVENISDDEFRYSFGLNGPSGIDREDLRADTRKAIGGFINAKGEIATDIKTASAIRKAKTEDKVLLRKQDYNFLWAGISNKYFASVIVPSASEGADFCDWLAEKKAVYYDLDGQKDTKDETIGVDFDVIAYTLEPGEKKQYDFKMFFGPKDRRLFDKDERYRKLGFINVIDFMPCFCCPAMIIRPLAFGVLWLMEWLYSFIPNYGVVIIILVFVVRICLHPLTKKSQVSMSKMSKLAPKVEQIKKKYANNKEELNKQIMALYREQGASPFTGMLPMFVQMPVWIALYSAIYASISLRGAAFLPFWITDLSAPDALFDFPDVTIPLILTEWTISSFNLLPILMGVAFYLQQKLMPKQASAATNPQLEQQQKMMMVMMPVMFPLLLYNSPSGLNLYIMSSVFAGVIEQYFIKKHIREKEEDGEQGLVSATSKTGGKAKKKKPKPFFKNM